MAKLKVSVNKNPTKEGIKVQFVLPQTLEGDAKAEAAQKLQSKLNQGLQQYNLTVSQDTDVPYSNVIGFLIPIADIKLLIKNAIGGGGAAEPAPEEVPSPEEPMKEIKRMQKLAGLKESEIPEKLINDPKFKELVAALKAKPEAAEEIEDEIKSLKEGIFGSSKKKYFDFGDATPVEITKKEYWVRKLRTAGLTAAAGALAGIAMAGGISAEDVMQMATAAAVGGGAIGSTLISTVGKK